MVDTRVTLSGITLDNPVIPASGTFGSVSYTHLTLPTICSV